MSILGAIFGPSRPPQPPPAPPAPPPVTSDPTPEMPGGGAVAEPAASDPTPAASTPAAPGSEPTGLPQTSASQSPSGAAPTPVDASAVKVGFGAADAAALDEDAARTHALKMQRLWRISDIATSLGAARQSDEPVGPPPAHVSLPHPGDLAKAARALQGLPPSDSPDLAHRI